MDSGTLFFVYYATLTMCAIIYIIYILLSRFKLACASNIAFAWSLFIIALPGYYVAAGTINDLIYDKFYTGFDIELYLIYLVYMPIMTIALIVGQACGQRMFVKVSPRKKINVKIKLLTIILCIYCLLFLIWLPYIPINNLILSSSYNFFDIYLQRLAVTHNLGDIEGGLPFVFRYCNNAARYILPALTYYYLIIKKVKVSSVVPVILLFIYVLYLQIYTIEKGPFMSFMLGILLVYFLRKQQVSTSKKIIEFGALLRYSAGLMVVFVCLFFVYSLFMGRTAINYYDFFLRFMNQSATDYVQIQYVRELGFLGFSGIKMPILTQLLNLPYVSVSSYAMTAIFPDYANAGFAGSGGGMSLMHLYGMFGWHSVYILFIFVFMFGFIDKITINSIYNRINANCFHLNISFYAMFILQFGMVLGSSVFFVFSIPTIFSAGLLIVMLIYFIIIKVPDRVYMKQISSSHYNSQIIN